MPPERQFEPNVQDPALRRALPRTCPTCSGPSTTTGSSSPRTARRRGARSPACEPSTFGFAVAVHPHDPKTAWFVPAVKDEVRYPGRRTGRRHPHARRRAHLRRPARRTASAARLRSRVSATRWMSTTPADGPRIRIDDRIGVDEQRRRGVVAERLRAPAAGVRGRARVLTAAPQTLEGHRSSRERGQIDRSPDRSPDPITRSPLRQLVRSIARSPAQQINRSLHLSNPLTQTSPNCYPSLMTCRGPACYARRILVTPPSRHRTRAGKGVQQCARR